MVGFDMNTSKEETVYYLKWGWKAPIIAMSDNNFTWVLTTDLLNHD